MNKVNHPRNNMRWNNSDYNEGSLKKRGISSIEIDICSLLAPNDIVPVSESNSIKKENMRNAIMREREGNI